MNKQVKQHKRHHTIKSYTLILHKFELINYSI